MTGAVRIASTTAGCPPDAGSAWRERQVVATRERGDQGFALARAPRRDATRRRPYGPGKVIPPITGPGKRPMPSWPYSSLCLCRASGPPSGRPCSNLTRFPGAGGKGFRAASDGTAWRCSTAVGKRGAAVRLERKPMQRESPQRDRARHIAKARGTRRRCSCA